MIIQVLEVRLAKGGATRREEPATLIGDIHAALLPVTSAHFFVFQNETHSDRCDQRIRKKLIADCLRPDSHSSQVAG